MSNALFGIISGIAISTSLPTLGAVVLIINVQDPSHVTFTATSNNSAITGNFNVDFDAGITLEGFFTVAQNITAATPVSISGNWTGRNAVFSYNEAVTFIYPNPAVQAGRDVSIYYNQTVANQQQFVTSAPPFSGSSSANLAAYTAALPLAGASGNLDAAFNGAPIGSWSVVPEPSETAFAVGLGVGAFALVRRFRSATSARR